MINKVSGFKFNQNTTINRQSVSFGSANLFKEVYQKEAITPQQEKSFLRWLMVEVKEVFPIEGYKIFKTKGGNLIRQTVEKGGTTGIEYISKGGDGKKRIIKLVREGLEAPEAYNFDVINNLLNDLRKSKTGK